MRMTKKNPDITSAPTVYSFVADFDTFQEFKKMVGDQNVSRELRAMIKDRVSLQKNEQASHSEQLVDPLNLSNLTQSGASDTLMCNNTRQSTLFETFASRDRRNEIVQYIQSVKDTGVLNRIEQNAKCMLKVSETHRQRLVAVSTRVWQINHRSGRPPTSGQAMVLSVKSVSLTVLRPSICVIKEQRNQPFCIEIQSLNPCPTCMPVPTCLMTRI